MVSHQLAVWEGIVSSLSKQRLSLQQEMEVTQQASTDLTEALDSKVCGRGHMRGAGTSRVCCTAPNRCPKGKVRWRQ